MGGIKKRYDLSIYKDVDTLLKVFRKYGRDPIQVGKNHDQYLCLSPFQKEKTPSCRIAALRHKKGTYGFKCFSSGVGGDVFTFIMRKEGVCFAVAVWIVRKIIAPEKEIRIAQMDKDPKQLELKFFRYHN